MRRLTSVLLALSCFGIAQNLGTGGISSASSGGGFTPPVTTTDLSTPSNPSAGSTKIYSKGGKWCSLDPSGNENCTGAATAPGGADTQIQYNNAGAFAGNANFVADISNTRFTFGNNWCLGWKDSAATVRCALQYDSSDILNLYNAKNNGQVYIHANGQISLSTENNNPVLIGSNSLTTIRIRQFDVPNQLNGVNIGSNFTSDPTRTLTLKDAIASAAAHTQMAIVAAQGDSPTVDRVFETCSNADSSCTTPVYSMTANGASDNYLGTPNAGVGLAVVKGLVSNLGTTTAVSVATDICASTACPAGSYESDFYLTSDQTCATPGPGAVAVTLAYTDAIGSKSITIPVDVNGATSLTGTLPLGNTTGEASGRHFFSLASGTAQYTTTLTACTTGTAKYSIKIVTRRLL